MRQGNRLWKRRRTKCSTKLIKEVKMERTKCERYSRVVGYIRPVQQWNAGKQAEWEDRVLFKVGASN
jgi:anaerobic ribonucleoside-triphosphate reductase